MKVEMDKGLYDEMIAILAKLPFESVFQLFKKLEAGAVKLQEPPKVEAKSE